MVKPKNDFPLGYNASSASFVGIAPMEIAGTGSSATLRAAY
jgi:hypothetical protein